MKLCIEGDIYFILKFHILETETVKLSIETGLILFLFKAIKTLLCFSNLCEFPGIY
jgi:hypothetical protein